MLTFLYYTLFSMLLYFFILFGLPVTLAIHIIIRYRVHEKWICFWSKYSCLPSGIQTIFGRLLGYGWCEHLYLNEFFKFTLSSVVFFFYWYVNNTDAIQVKILKNVFCIWNFHIKILKLCSYMEGWVTKNCCLPPLFICNFSVKNRNGLSNQWATNNIYSVWCN